MTIATNTSTITYTGNGSTTAFAVPYVFFDPTELVVVSRNIATGVETTQLLTTNYTVSGGNGAVGTVTAVVAPPSTVTWTIYRNTAQTQNTAFPNQGPFPSTAMERALDRLTALVQEISRGVLGTLRVPSTETLPAPLPSAQARANLVQGYGPAGEPVLLAPATLATGNLLTLYDLAFDFGQATIPTGDRRGVKMVRDYQIPAGFTGSSASIGVAPTGSSAVFNIYRGASGSDTLIGTMTVTTAGAVTFASTGGVAQTVPAAEYLYIDPPNPANAALRAVWITIRGSA